LWQLSDNDLDESTESEESGSESSNESEGNVSDIEDNDDEEQKDQLETCRDFKINLNRRVDEMDESEIDRLCDLHNLNKRKCLKALGSGRKKRKRIRLLSTSSSSSSEEPSENSTTPDLVMDTEERPSTPNDIEPSDAVAVLADELADKLSDERVEISSDSEMDVDDRPKTKKKSEEIVRKEEEEIYEIKSDDEVQEEVQGKTLKKRASWRDDPLLGSLWTDSDDSDSGIPEVKKSDSGDDKDRKSPPKVSNETTVISDSSDTSSDSDDVTFVDEVTDGVKGRRNIRSILSDDELSEMSQLAKKEEKERVTRLKEHTKTIESIRSQNEDFVLDADVKTGEPLVTVRAELATMLKPHQKTGVQFMWQACYESVAILKEKPGTGCILAHCMGLGKTLQVVTLVYTLFAHPVTNTRHVLIICPLSTVINWKNEFKKALKQLTRRVDTPIYCLIKADLTGKIKVVINWRRTGGVLIMGYDTFQIITNEKTASKVSADEKKAALEALIDPGPDLVVCDEGHMLKNGKTLKTQAVMRVKTKRRIVLTGTPLQNNLKEYYFMVQFVKPHLLGTYQEYMNRFATPIMNGQYHDSRPEDIKLMKKRTHVLTNLLKKTINRVEAKTLSTYLPEITDYTIFIKLTPIQVALYTKFIDMVTSQNDLSAVFFHVTRVTNFNNLHPYTLQLYVMMLYDTSDTYDNDNFSTTSPSRRRKRRRGGKMSWIKRTTTRVTSGTTGTKICFQKMSPRTSTTAPS
jgi:transcriptional regulator ATRX